MHTSSKNRRGKNPRKRRARKGVVVGITGGIATGKSTLAAALRRMGAGYYSVDEAAHVVYRPGTREWRAILRSFGPEVAGPGGRICREKLGEIVTASRRALLRLEGIVHPKLRREAKSAIRRLRGRYRLVVVEAGPLLFRLGLHSMADLVVWTRCPHPVQCARLRRTRCISPAAARRWLRALRPAQSSLDRDFARAANGMRIDMTQGVARLRALAQSVVNRALAVARGGEGVEGGGLAFNR
jgi:dephospho-CoA kinase